MTYDETLDALQTLCEVPLNNADENFQRIVPSMFLYADGRIYRDIAFLATLTTQTLVMPVSQFNREVLIPPTVVVLEGANIITPVSFGPVVNNFDSRTPLERIAPQVLDFLWPQQIFQMGVPRKYAVIGAVLPTLPFSGVRHIIRLMPTPDQPYLIEMMGEVRPLPLSEQNPTTYLSVVFPELFLAACMIFAAGYQRDFGAQADDPSRALSWEAQYSNLKQGVLVEAARMRGEGPGWTALPPVPAASPPRAP